MFAFFHSDPKSRKWRIKKNVIDEHPTSVHMTAMKKKSCACDFCGKVLSSEKSLLQHQKRHGKTESEFKERFSCVRCNKTFSTKHNLRHHITAVHEGRKFKCTMCSHEFKSKSGLEYHVKVHKGEYEFKCEICGREFVEKRHGEQQGDQYQRGA